MSKSGERIVVAETHDETLARKYEEMLNDKFNPVVLGAYRFYIHTILEDSEMISDLCN